MVAVVLYLLYVLQDGDWLVYFPSEVYHESTVSPGSTDHGSAI